MNIEGFIKDMPKVELNVHLDGAYQIDTLMTIADQNEIAAEFKHFRKWVDILNNPDAEQLPELLQTVGQWLRIPEDQTRLVYDTGVYLYQQSVRYAEVIVNPVHLMLPGQSYEEFLKALNDGRDRLSRGWGIDIRWIFVVPRDEPRRSDEIARWAASASAKRGGVVGFGLLGPEGAQPIGQFERAFTLAEKKEVFTVADAGMSLEAEGILDTINHLKPKRLNDGWGTVDAPDVIGLLDQNNIPLVNTIGRALFEGRLEKFSAYPLQQLYDANVRMIISVDKPTFYHTSLNDEYLGVVEHTQLGLDELQEIALNAVRYSFLSDGEKAAMIADFEQQYAALSEKHTAEANVEAP